MKGILKKLGIVGGGTAAACAACCAVPSLLAPLLAVLGISGLAFSPWLAALVAIPAGILAVRFLLRRADFGKPAKSVCGCQSVCSMEQNQSSSQCG